MMPPGQMPGQMPGQQDDAQQAPRGAGPYL
jgi:hypothetical protein